MSTPQAFSSRISCRHLTAIWLSIFFFFKLNNHWLFKIFPTAFPATGFETFLMLTDDIITSKCKKFNSVLRIYWNRCHLSITVVSGYILIYAGNMLYLCLISRFLKILQTPGLEQRFLTWHPGKDFWGTTDQQMEWLNQRKYQYHGFYCFIFKSGICSCSQAR